MFMPIEEYLCFCTFSSINQKLSSLHFFQAFEVLNNSSFLQVQIPFCHVPTLDQALFKLHRHCYMPLYVIEGDDNSTHRKMMFTTY